MLELIKKTSRIRASPWNVTAIHDEYSRPSEELNEIKHAEEQNKIRNKTKDESMNMDESNTLFHRTIHLEIENLPFSLVALVAS